MRNSIVIRPSAVQYFAILLRTRTSKVSAVNIHKAFTEHPRSVGETYLQHMGVAGRCGLSMMTAGFACLIHAALPFLFTNTASDCLTRLHERMVTKRSRLRQLSSTPDSLGASSPR
ncbi:MAG TPA: DUF6356 family protein [Steroidobacteraceae bacterium]|jgi:hypothetical protein|nr:DUF6356 family protein [Steroidobacteraceae bacterium]HNS27347.1 DUF6356 family protein [Steroidobacteraceae bacterium]